MIVVMIWDVCIFGRGSDEIGSGLLQFLSAPDLPIEPYVISYNCSGQNKKWTIIHMWHNLVADEFDNILHIFPISGHTMLPCNIW